MSLDPMPDALAALPPHEYAELHLWRNEDADFPWGVAGSEPGRHINNDATCALAAALRATRPAEQPDTTPEER